MKFTLIIFILLANFSYAQRYTSTVVDGDTIWHGNISPQKEGDLIVDSLIKSGINKIIFYYRQDGTYGWGGGIAEANILWKEGKSYFFQHIDDLSFFGLKNYGQYKTPFAYYTTNEATIKEEEPFESHTLQRYYDVVDTVWMDDDGQLQGIKRMAPLRGEVEQFKLRIIHGDDECIKEITGNHFNEIANPRDYLKNYDLKFFRLMNIIQKLGEMDDDERLLKRRY